MTLSALTCVIDGSLDKLLVLLKSHKVHIFKTKDLELQFHVEQGLESPRPATEDHTIEVKPDEGVLPVDLKTDNITDFDKILHWSGAAQDEESLPLIVEEALAAP